MEADAFAGADRAEALGDDLRVVEGVVVAVGLVLDDEPREFGQVGAEQFASAGGEDGTQILCVPGDRQLVLLGGECLVVALHVTPFHGSPHADRTVCRLRPTGYRPSDFHGTG